VAAGEDQLVLLFPLDVPEDRLEDREIVQLSECRLVTSAKIRAP
jgi:hypothetical protein